LAKLLFVQVEDLVILRLGDGDLRTAEAIRGLWGLELLLLSRGHCSSVDGPLPFERLLRCAQLQVRPRSCRKLKSLEDTLGVETLGGFRADGSEASLVRLEDTVALLSLGEEGLQ